ncbi:MAG: site-specific DNA-methyltransferase [Phycisphaerales bacterium]|jgi:DNA modification methylase|nr:site-specific DNA-methyltransferase [Phycisphaerales bacterium]
MADDANADGVIACADWLSFARTLPPASVDLLYADPPFNTGRTQRTPPAAERAGRNIDTAYDDAWPSVQDWLAWLHERLEATLPALRPSASVLLHVDWRTCHHARLLLDDLLGPDRFVNNLVWSYGLGGSSPRRFARKHDDILFYCLDPDLYWFDPPRVPATSRRMAGLEKKATDVLDVPALNNMAAERTGYPTQKPLALLDLLVRACCPPGGLVLDPCCGSGTTLVASLRAGRRAIGCDASEDAVRIARARLADEPASSPDTPRGTPA